MIEPIVHTIKLQMEDTGTRDTGIRIKQNDAGIVFYIYVYYNGKLYFDENIKPNVVFKKANGNSVVGECTLDSSGYYIYTMIGNELNVPGKVVMDVKFTLENGRESTHSVTFECVQDTVTEQLEISNIRPEDLFSVIERLERELAEVRTAITEGQNVLDGIEEAMQDENVQAISNAVVNAENAAQTAQTSATDAQGFAANAQTDAGNAQTSASESSSARDEAQGFRNEAEGFRNDANTAKDNAVEAVEDCQRIKDSMVVDSEMSTTSENPVQNKVVATAVNSLDENLNNIIAITNYEILDSSVSQVNVKKNGKHIECTFNFKPTKTSFLVIKLPTPVSPRYYIPVFNFDTGKAISGGLWFTENGTLQYFGDVSSSNHVAHIEYLTNS